MIFINLKFKINHLKKSEYDDDDDDKKFEVWTPPQTPKRTEFLSQDH